MNPPSTAVAFVAAAAGTADFVVASASAGALMPSQASVVSGQVYKYIAISPDGTTWEVGTGAYNSSTITLPRTTIQNTSNADTSLVNFPVAPTVYVFGFPVTNGELFIQNQGGDQLHLINNNYGVIHRNDDSNYFILLTNSGSAMGEWNALRPFYINNSTGAVTMSNGVIVNGGETVNGGLTSNGATQVNNANLVVNVGDIYTYRSGGTTGAIFLTNSGTRYLYFDGTNYQLGGSGIPWTSGNLNAVLNVRLAYVTDVGNPGWVGDNYAGAVITGLGVATGQFVTQVAFLSQTVVTAPAVTSVTVRFRYVQIDINGTWFTVGLA